MRRHALIAALALGLASLASPAFANWTASGRVLYQHRDWDQTGFTGAISALPVRFADVEVIDPTKSGGKAILARGKTDATGNFSIPVTDSTTRSKVRVRILTTTAQTSDLFVKVTNQSGTVYAFNSSDVANHGPNTNVNWGTMTAAAFAGGEAFNILDLGIYGADYIKAMTGTRPSSAKLVTFKWAANGGVTVAYTSGNTIVLRDSAGYDDTVILHEWAHYAMNNYSKTSSPGGTHYLSDCNEDPRLAFDEARASFLGCAVRRFNGWAFANVYVRTDGGSGLGRVLNWYNLEDPEQYACQGDTSEVANSRTMWDIGDGAATADLSPATDDTPQDTLTLSDTLPWRVFAGPIKNATYVTAESFWDGWFDPTIANGNLTGMKGIWSYYTIEFFPDVKEPNNTTVDAKNLSGNEAPIHLTYFSDANGDGKGESDIDLFKFNATGGSSYTVQTSNLLSAADTVLEILDSNGSTVLASNDNRATGDPSSRVTWTAPRTDIFYIRSKRATTGYTAYGSYDLTLTSP